jgi:hypothetical protein
MLDGQQIFVDKEISRQVPLLMENCVVAEPKLSVSLGRFSISAEGLGAIIAAVLIVSILAATAMVRAGI